MRRDPEAVADYCRILEAQGVDTAEMSDGHVLLAAVLNTSREMATYLESLRPAVLRSVRITVDLQVEAFAARLAHEAAMDLQLRDEVGLDVALLELFDDEPRP